MPRSAFVGFCLTAFACGVVTTVAVDRIWPRRADDAPVLVQPARAADLPTPPPARPEVHAIAPAAIAPAAIAIAPSPVAETRPPAPARVATAVTPSPGVARKRPVAVAERAALAESPPAPPAPTAKWVDPFE